MALIEWGVAAAPLPGETESGDQFAVHNVPGGTLVVIVDGLGHGTEAKAAADAALSVVAKHPEEALIPLTERCHREVIRTRGAVMSLARFNTTDHTVNWLGVGNIEGLLLRADRDAAPGREWLLLRPGTLGHRLPLLHASILPILQDDLLILATDGIRHGFDQGVVAGEPAQRIADRILAHHHLGTDDALVWVGRYRRDAG